MKEKQVRTRTSVEKQSREKKRSPVSMREAATARGKLQEYGEETCSEVRQEV